MPYLVFAALVVWVFAIIGKITSKKANKEDKRKDTDELVRLNVEIANLRSKVSELERELKYERSKD